MIDLLDRPTYDISQVDGLLGLRSGTAWRWIDGYERAGRHYAPVVRSESTGEETITWGEFVEARLLSEFRDKGVPILRMRQAVEVLRERLHTRYPLAHARPFLDAAGRELVQYVQDEVRLERPLRIVVVRSGQVVLSEEAEQFVRSANFEGADDDRAVTSLYPYADEHRVVIDPLRRFGAPVVRGGVPTDVLAEQFRRGDPIEMLADLYELSDEDVQAAIRYEFSRVSNAIAA